MRRLFLVLTIYFLISACGSSSQSVKNTSVDSASELTASTVYTPPETSTTAPVEIPSTTYTPPETSTIVPTTSSTMAPTETTTTAPTTSSAREEQENNVSEEWEIAFESQINSLTVNNSGQAPVSYDRDDWGSGWGDEDGDCINTRHEVLILESLEPVAFSASGCSVISGYWYGAFAGTYTSNPSSFDIDHFVPLANAHHSGGWAWNAEKKNAFYNDLSDPQHLIAVSASQNRSKGARGPDEWKPADPNYWCQYAFSWVSIKMRWELSVTPAELEALVFMAQSCDDPPSTNGIPPLPVVNNPTTTIPSVTPTTAPVTSDSTTPPNPGNSVNCSDFPTWDEAKEWFDTYYPYYGDIGDLDRNGDLNPCESLPGAP